MVDTPKEIEVNVVMGAQLRAIVRSALLHVRNRMKESDHNEDFITAIDEELVKWPLSADPEDTLAEWLDWRYGRYMEPGEDGEQTDARKKFWEHEAAAVRRAVGRGGFKLAPEGTGVAPIDALNEANAKSGNMVKGVVDLELKHTQTLGEAIRTAVGAASMCWTNMRQAGVFKSEEALDISTQLEHHFNDHITRMKSLVLGRHDALGRRLRAYRDRGDTMISIQQAYQILTGTAAPEEYDSALQVRPYSEEEKAARDGR